MSDYVPGLRLFVHFECALPRRGRPALEYCRRGLQMVFDNYDVEAVYAATDLRHAAMFMAWLGFKRVAKLPRFTVEGGQIKDVYLYRLTRKQWADQ